MRSRKYTQGAIDPTSGRVTRIAGDRWTRIRRGLLQAQPLCVRCSEKGLVALATEIDHVIALVNGGDNSAENLMPLCSDCHDEKTRRDMGWKPRPKIGLDGWPE